MSVVDEVRCNLVNETTQAVLHMWFWPSGFGGQIVDKQRWNHSRESKKSTINDPDEDDP